MEGEFLDRKMGDRKMKSRFSLFFDPFWGTEKGTENGGAAGRSSLFFADGTAGLLS